MARLLGLALALGISALIIVAILSLPTWMKPWQAGTIAAGMILVSAYFSVRAPVPHAFAIYIWLIIAMVLAAGFVLLLSQLGPYAVMTLAAGATISVIILSINRLTAIRNRHNTNLCEHCGYDLRASTDRCPECGNEISGDLQRRRRIREEMLAKRTKPAEQSIESPPESPDNFSPTSEGE